MNELSHHNNNVSTNQPSKRANASVHAKSEDVAAQEANEADQKSKKTVQPAVDKNQTDPENQESSVKA